MKYHKRPRSKFPNKVIEQTYEKAKGRTFTRLTSDMSFRDEKRSDDYNHHALQWLLDHGYMDRSLDRERFVFLYKIVR